MLRVQLIRSLITHIQLPCMLSKEELGECLNPSLTGRLLPHRDNRLECGGEVLVNAVFFTETIQL